MPACEVRRNLAPVVDAFHILIKTKELKASGRKNHSFPYSKVDVATVAVDRDTTLQNCDEKKMASLLGPNHPPGR